MRYPHGLDRHDEALLASVKRAREELRAVQARLRGHKLTEEDLRAAAKAIDAVAHKTSIGGELEPRAVNEGVERAAIRQAAPFDLITANILAGPLVRLAPKLARLVAPGGHIVLSGLLDAQAREVRATYLRLGLSLETWLSIEGWTTLILRWRGR